MRNTPLSMGSAWDGPAAARASNGPAAHRTRNARLDMKIIVARSSAVCGRGSASALQSGDALDVGRVREHVERAHLYEHEAPGGEVADVAGQRRGIAGHVDDAARLELGDPGHDAGVESG